MPGTFTIKAASDNIRATPVMAPANVQLCVDNSVTKWDRDLVMYHEMGARRLATLLEKHPEWAAVQGPAGDRGRSAIAYRTDTYDLIEFHVVQASHADLGPVHVPSGNRWALVATFRAKPKVTALPAMLHKNETVWSADEVRKASLRALDRLRAATQDGAPAFAAGGPVGFGDVFAVIAYHSVAHMNVGGRYGYTGTGSPEIQALKGKMENPFIAVYKEGMATLEGIIKAFHAGGVPVLVGGDWNFDAFADMQYAAVGKNEPTAPYATMERAGIQTIYSTKKLTDGTDGSRGIDYLGVSKPFGLVDAKILRATAEANLPTDHDFVTADMSVTIAVPAPPKPPTPAPAPVVKKPAAPNRIERARSELTDALALLDAAVKGGRTGDVQDGRDALVGVLKTLPAK